LFACLLFFFTIPPPPTPTLFPYTTLFRSDLLSGGADAHAEAAACLGAVVEELARRATDLEVRRRALATWQRVDAARWLPAAFDLDRKSTRLNSSHVAISYAVFCLKKKKQQ